jgi:hypothetical protein
MEIILRYLFALAVCCSLNAATYYVRKDGNNSNSGTADNAGGAWLTLAKASATAVSGDTVYVRQGEYSERLVLANNNTTWIGERSGDSWVTIIDPSAALTTGWVEAQEIGAGVWKNATVNYMQDQIILDDLRVSPIRFTESAAYAKSVLELAASYEVTYPNVLGSQEFRVNQFWDDVECVFWRAQDITDGAPPGPVYIRFRDGDEPNGMDLRVSSNGGWNSGNDNYAALWIRSHNNLVSNLWVRGSYVGVSIRDAHSNTVSSSYFTHGQYQFMVRGSSAHNLIESNRFELLRYGTHDTNYGAWGGGLEQKHAYRLRNYLQGKPGLGDPLITFSMTSPEMLFLESTGASNRVVGNVFANGIQGCSFGFYESSSAQGTVIAHNTISNLCESGIKEGRGHNGSLVYSNTVWDCHTLYRFQSWNLATVDRSTFIFGNLFGNPRGVGGAHFALTTSAAQTYHPTNYIYHNTYSGGRSFWELTGAWPTYADLRNVAFLNNIISCGGLFISGGAGWNSGASYVGEFDHNLLANRTSFTAAWDGGNNVLMADYAFVTDDPLTSWTGVDPAIDIGVDVSEDGSYDLPGFDSGYFNGSAPDAGAIQMDSPDPFTVFVEATMPIAYERGLGAGQFTFTRAGGTTGNITVDYTISGTATAGADFVAFSDSVVIADGNATATATVTPIANETYTGNLTVIVTIDAGTGYTPTDPQSATVVIVDSDLNPAVGRGRPPAGQVLMVPTL